MADNNMILCTTLQTLMEGKKYSTLRDILVTMNPTDIATVFQEMEQEKLPLLFRLLPKELAAETFVEMEPENQELLIHGFSDSELREVMSNSAQDKLLTDMLVSYHLSIESSQMSLITSTFLSCPIRYALSVA